jgi:tetratricopeptide (TPR) repeat protein
MQDVAGTAALLAVSAVVAYRGANRMSPTVATPPPLSPMDPIYDALGDEIQQRMTAAPEGVPADLSPVAGRVLAVPPGRLDRPADAARFLHLLGFLSRQPGTKGRRAWDWAKQVAGPHPQQPDVLGLLAALGDQLRQVDPSTEDAISPAELATLFRRSMELAPDRPTAFGRAGLFFLHQGDDEEAERCLAAAFRLDPTSGFIAQQLADLYDHHGRPADGLAVLDACLRATPPQQPDNPDLLWKAGLAAVSLGRHAAVADYFGRLEHADPGRRWVAYYRAIASLELGRFADAALAIEREAGLIKMPTALHIHTVRAAAAAGLGDVGALRRHVDAAVRSPLSLVDYLPPAGVFGCFTRLWIAARSLDADDTVTARLGVRVLASGLTPVEFWDDARSAGTTVDGLTPFWCDLRQPVDERWAAAGHALPGSEKWPAYRIRFGVLAANADEARAIALDWQGRSASLPATVESVTVAGETQSGKRGVTRRGFPEPG